MKPTTLVLPAVTGLRSATKHPAAQSLIKRARRTAHQIDNTQVRQLRGLLRACRGAEPPDVVYFGESTVSWVAPEDKDPTRLVDMVIGELAPTLRTYAVHGGSYQADLLRSMARLVATEARKPTVIVVPLWIRGRLLPWIHHPVLGYEREIAFLDSLPERPALRTVHASYRRARSADFERYYRLAHPTLLGERTIGEYVRDLHRPPDEQSPDARARILYAYHQGAELDPAGEGLAAVRELGAQLRAARSAVVAYETPVCVAEGERLLGPELRSVVTRNFERLRDAFAEGYGSADVILRTGQILKPSSFIDPSLADEHLNEAGRAEFCSRITAAVRDAAGAV